ncbi:MAG: hypothetical protein Tsb0021_09630 [Chlamydiales bacterium]
MKILVSGSSGLVGTSLVSFLDAKGHEVTRLLRTEKKSHLPQVIWDPYSADADISKFEGFDAVINVAGENIASGRWTKTKKHKIRQSRVQLTENLVEVLKKTKNPPKIFLNASAIGYYGDTGDVPATEESPAGTGFLAEVCRDWEKAALGGEAIGMRVVTPRIGMVLSSKGGALHKMLTPFRLGLGGVLGSGEQFMSWITLKDLIHLFVFCLENEEIQGAVNATAPNPVTNREFTKTLGHVLNRPTVIPMPKFLLQTLFGEMAQELLLVNTRVIPHRLVHSAFHFEHPKIDIALKEILK